MTTAGTCAQPATPQPCTDFQKTLAQCQKQIEAAIEESSKHGIRLMEVWKRCKSEVIRLVCSYESSHTGCQAALEPPPHELFQQVQELKNRKAATFSSIERKITTLFEIDGTDQMIVPPDWIPYLPLEAKSVRTQGMTCELFSLFIYFNKPYCFDNPQTIFQEYTQLISEYAEASDEYRNKLARAFCSTISLTAYLRDSHILESESSEHPLRMVEEVRPLLERLFQDFQKENAQDPHCKDTIDRLTASANSLISEIERVAIYIQEYIRANVHQELQNTYFQHITIANRTALLQTAGLTAEALHRGILSKKEIKALILFHSKRLSTESPSFEELIASLENIRTSLSQDEVDSILNKIQDYELLPLLCSQLTLAKEIASSKIHSFKLQHLFRYLFLGGSVQRFLVLAQSDSKLVPPSHLQTKEGVQFLESLSQQQLTIILNKLILPYFHKKQVSVQEIQHLLENTPLLKFLASLQDVQELSEESKRALFTLLTTPQITLGSVTERELSLIKGYLSFTEYAHLLAGIAYHELTAEGFYNLEFLGSFAPSIQKLALHTVPIEPLIRWISTLPFSEAQAWLKTPISTPDGNRRRMDTLSEEQKHTILRRFRRFDSPLPQEPWMQLFGIDDTTAWEMCKTELLPLSQTEERWNCQMGELIDPKDQLSLFLSTWQTSIPPSENDRGFFYRSLVVWLLKNGKENTICGSRNFLTWGTASEYSSLCCSDDSIPLTVRIKGQPTQIYTGGLFSDTPFPVPAFTLRRKVLDILTTVSFEHFCTGEALSDTQKEVYFEVERIARQIATKYPQIIERYLEGNYSSSDFEDVQDSAPSDSESSSDRSSDDEAAIREEELAQPPSPSLPVADPEPTHSLADHFRDHIEAFVRSEEMLSTATLHELVKALYRHITRNQRFSELYDSQSRSNTATYCLLSLLWLCRHATIEEQSATSTIVTLSPKTQYLLKTFADETFEVRYEDNPWLTPEQFHTFASSYAPHTLSPLTPDRNFPPSCFSALCNELKAIASPDFYTLCEKTIALRSMEDDTAANYIDAFEKLLPEGKTLSEEAHRLLIHLVDHYMTFVSDVTQAILPNKTYFFNIRGAGQFVDPSTIPLNIRSEGNYASAIAYFYNFVQPSRHDGNCCVESILIALNGIERYRDEKGKEALTEDIRNFRVSLVEYAKEHEADLKAEFGDQQVDRLLLRYAGTDLDEWTDTVALACISRRYGHPIQVYSRTSPMFTTDEKGELEPSAIFYKEKITTGAPIRLMYWDECHYCLLVEKQTTPQPLR